MGYANSLYCLQGCSLRFTRTHQGRACNLLVRWDGAQVRWLSLGGTMWLRRKSAGESCTARFPGPTTGESCGQNLTSWEVRLLGLIAAARSTETAADLVSKASVYSLHSFARSLSFDAICSGPRCSGNPQALAGTQLRSGRRLRSQLHRRFQDCWAVCWCSMCRGVVGVLPCRRPVDQRRQRLLGGRTCVGPRSYRRACTASGARCPYQLPQGSR